MRHGSLRHGLEHLFGLHIIIIARSIVDHTVPQMSRLLYRLLSHVTNEIIKIYTCEYIGNTV